MTSPIIEKIVRNGLCIGCGTCVGLCPRDALTIVWNKNGEYQPIEIDECKNNCGICLKVCPFSTCCPDEDAIGKTLFGGVSGISHSIETGYYLTSYAGFSINHRLRSASGGIATWVLEALFEHNVIDHVICVAQSEQPGKLFSYTIFNSIEGFRNGAGSFYYPVELSNVIKHIMNEPGRYAIVGLPCFIKSIRLAQTINSRLRDRIVFTLGLVCGQAKSRLFTDYAASLAGIDERVSSVRYRMKNLNQPSTNYYFRFILNNGEQRQLYWNEGLGETWINRFFTFEACDFCDDVFAECADIVCMDAWLPEYTKDGSGTSMVIVRSHLIRNLLDYGNGVQLQPIPIEKIIESQKGVVISKRRHLAYRLYLIKKQKMNVVIKRLEPSASINFLLKKEIIIKQKIRKNSGHNWIASNRDLEMFNKLMKPEMSLLFIINKIGKLLSIPFTFIRFIRGRIN